MDPKNSLHSLASLGGGDDERQPQQEPAGQETAIVQEIEEKLKERKDRNADDSRLLPELAQAQNALAGLLRDFNERIAADNTDEKTFADIQELTENLKRQRDQAEAHAQSVSQHVVDKLRTSLAEFVKTLEDLEGRKANLLAQQEAISTQMAAIKLKLNQVLKDAQASLRPEMEGASRVIGGNLPEAHYDSYIGGIEQYLTTISWYRFSEKGPLKILLEHKQEFLDLEKLSERYASLGQDAQSLKTEIEQALAKYQELIIQNEEQA